MESILYTVTVYTENQVGLLNQISIIFGRRRLNIESLSVSASAIEGIHKFIITTNSDRDTIQKVVQQIEKRIDLYRRRNILPRGGSLQSRNRKIIGR